MADWWDKETKAAVKRIGMNVRLLRVEQGLKQEEIALETGMARSHVSQLERGIVAPSIHSLLRLAKALDVEPAAFLRDVKVKR